MARVVYKVNEPKKDTFGKKDNAIYFSLVIIKCNCLPKLKSCMNY